MLISLSFAQTASAANYVFTCSDNSFMVEETYSLNSFIAIEGEKQKVDFNGDGKFDEADVKKARVVEISETLPGTDEAVGNSFIINAYKGSCCPSDKVNGSQCKAVAYVYSDSYNGCISLICGSINGDEQVTCEENAGHNCQAIQILVSASGIGLLKFYALQLYVWGASIVGIIAVLIIVISGMQIAASGGEDQMSSAKTRIMQSLAGLALLFLSALILYTINPTFFTS